MHVRAFYKLCIERPFANCKSAATENSDPMNRHQTSTSRAGESYNLRVRQTPVPQPVFASLSNTSSTHRQPTCRPQSRIGRKTPSGAPSLTARTVKTHKASGISTRRLQVQSSGTTLKRSHTRQKVAVTQDVVDSATNFKVISSLSL